MSVTTTSMAQRTGVLGIKLAAFLLKRSSFRFTKPRVDELSTMTAAQAVNNLFNTSPPSPYIPRPLDYNIHSYNGGEWIDDDDAPTSNETNRRQWVTGWWFRNALYDPSATHKLAFFIHTFFTISHVGLAPPSGLNTHVARSLYDHLTLLNWLADNNASLKTMAKKMTLDTTMLCYLNNRSSIAGDENENYARELLELFTIGRSDQNGEDNYTEEDITQAARVLTGFTTYNGGRTSNPNFDDDTDIRRGIADTGTHDSGNKTFSDKFDDTIIVGKTTATGMFEELDELIEMIFAQEATARNYARKMYRFYVDPVISPAIESSVITALSNHLMNYDYDLVRSLKYLLRSQHFYSMCTGVEGGGNIIKSPIELMTDAMSFFNSDLPPLPNSPSAIDIEHHFDDFVTHHLFNRYGQNTGLLLFGPPSVAGYPAYYQEPLMDKNWYGGPTIPTRYDVGSVFVKRYVSNNIHTSIDTLAFAHYLNDVEGVDVSNADALLDAILNYLFSQTLTTDRRDLIKNIFLDDLSETNWECEWALYNGGNCNGTPVTPDGDENRVRPHLDALVCAVLSAQEFQLK